MEMIQLLWFLRLTSDSTETVDAKQTQTDDAIRVVFVQLLFSVVSYICVAMYKKMEAASERKRIKGTTRTNESSSLRVAPQPLRLQLQRSNYRAHSM